MAFAHCVSLGPTCHAAAFLQAHPASLRTFALPFDWTHPDADTVASCLADGCAIMLDRSRLEPVGAGKKRSSRHRTLQHADKRPLFNHHAPATSDADFCYLHRAADRLRRVLADSQRRSLFFHLRVGVQATPGPESRAAFLRDADMIFAALRQGRQPQGNFKLVMVRAVQQQAAPAAGRCEILRSTTKRGSRGSAELVVLELMVRTKTVVPMAARPAPDPEAEQADLMELAAAFDSGHAFSPQPLPALTDAARSARSRCGPAWLVSTPAICRNL